MANFVLIYNDYFSRNSRFDYRRMLEICIKSINRTQSDPSILVLTDDKNLDLNISNVKYLPCLSEKEHPWDTQLLLPEHLFSEGEKRYWYLDVDVVLTKELSVSKYDLRVPTEELTLGVISKIHDVPYSVLECEWGSLDTLPCFNFGFIELSINTNTRNLFKRVYDYRKSSNLHLAYKGSVRETEHYFAYILSSGDFSGCSIASHSYLSHSFSGYPLAIQAFKGYHYISEKYHFTPDSYQNLLDYYNSAINISNYAVLKFFRGRGLHYVDTCIFDGCIFDGC